MDTRTFFENFRYVAEAPNGTTLLRSLILHAATHGHFRLPQDAKVPASLLPATEYHTHSEVPVANIGHDLDKPLLPVPPEVQRAYPRSWTTGRLGSYIQLISGQHLSPSEQNGSGIGIPYLTGASDLGDHYPKVCRWTTSPKALAKRGDLVISVKGTIGKINEIDVPEVALGRQLMAVRAMGFTKDYLALVLSSYKSDFKQKSIGIAIPGINRDDIRQLVVGIPSTPEQAFIVTKVDELLALCDTLDVKLVALKKQTTILSGELSDQFCAMPTPTNLQSAFLMRDAPAGKDLRAIVIDLAVKGQLLSQDADEGSGEDLIRTVNPIGSQKNLQDSIASQERPFDLPQSWFWATLGDIAPRSDSGWSPKCLDLPRSGDDWGVLKVSAVSWGKFRPEENKALPSQLNGRPECEVKDGDFLLSRANTAELVARSVVVDNAPPRLMMSDKIVRFHIAPEINKRFVDLYHGSKYARAHYAANATGTSSSMKNISRATMERLPVPIPPRPEQDRIVACASRLFDLIEELTVQRLSRDRVACAYAQAAVEAVTGISVPEHQEMKVPKTEIIARLRAAKYADAGSTGPLSAQLANQEGGLPAKDLWQRSGFAIEAFYQQLKTEMSRGWIVEPEPATVREVRED